MSKIPSTAPIAIRLRLAVHIPRYKVLLHNDDKNSMDHVVMVLKRVFNFGQHICEQIMMEAHRNGVALCIVEPLEQAEFHRDRILSYFLIATIEPE
jgi:ATP-dependent Clp protease adaptor protein ClpS